MACRYCLDFVPGPNGEGFVAHAMDERHRLNYLLHSFDRDKMSKNLHDVILRCHRNTPVEVKKKGGLLIVNAKLRDQIKVELEIDNTDREDPIYLTEMTRLYKSPIFTLSDDNKMIDRPIGSGPTAKILPKSSLGLRIQANCEAEGSFRCPIHFRFTKYYNTQKQVDFSVVKELDVRVVEKDSDPCPDPDEEKESPFLGEAWRDCEQTVWKTTKGSRGDERLEPYHIPPDLKPLLLKNMVYWKGMSVEERMRLDKMTEKYTEGVNKTNYRQYFHDLLYMEEFSNKLKIAKYNMSNVSVKMFGEKAVILEVAGLAEKRPSVLKHDYIFLRVIMGNLWETTQYQGEVTEVLEKSVVISGLDPYILQRLRKAEQANKPLKLAVKFTFSRYPLMVQHAALDLLPKDPDLMTVLFPDAKTAKSGVNLVKDKRLDSLKFVNTNVEGNPQQKAAVLNILRGSSLPAPYVIFGPPGTGKTVTLVETIVQIRRLFPNSRVLVCAQSNATCDYIATKLFESGTFPCAYNAARDDLNKLEIVDLLRLNSKSRGDDFPNALRGICTSDVTNAVLDKTGVVVCTLITAARLRVKSNKKRYSHVLIDEAGQAAECEALVALVGQLQRASPTEHKGILVLAGDPKQLGPVCNSEKAQHFGLDKSLLDRLMEMSSIYSNRIGAEGYDSRFITKLLRNFRSHPDILKISNKLFYDNELIPAYRGDALSSYCFKTKQMTGGHAVIFHGVLHQEGREGKSPSFFNLGEVKEVVNYVKLMLSDDFPIDVAEEDIGVVTPYARQVSKIKSELRHKGWTNISVGTTEIFQGREKRVIIVSTVRSQVNMLQCDKKFRIGFVKNPRRFNVAMTRAQSKNIIIGNPVLLGLDKTWSPLIQDAMRGGFYIGCPVTLRDQNWVDDTIPAIDRIKSRREE